MNNSKTFVEQRSAAGSSDSLLTIAAALIRAWRLLFVAVCFGGGSALVYASFRQETYTSVTSFIAQSGGDGDLGALRSLAGQFGLPLGGANAGPSADFYAGLVSSDVVLDSIVADSIPRASEGFMAIEELLTGSKTASDRRTERAREKSRKAVRASLDRRTNVVTVRVRTTSREGSLRISELLLARVNEVNLRMRQTRARDERRFMEERTQTARVALLVAENDLQAFMERNRDYGTPRLKFGFERLNRAVSLRQQLLATLEQALEDARLREVRDVPVITVLQPPSSLIRPDPQGRLTALVLGVLISLLFGGAFVIVRLFLERRFARDDEAVADALASVACTRNEFRELANYVLRRKRSLS
jgi:uncharacterized protein involved in exopolysaccharide biosynthesis